MIEITINAMDKQHERGKFSEFFTKMNNWVNERTNPVEKRVRNQIYKAARTDLEKPSNPKGVDHVKEYQVNVDRMLQYVLEELEANNRDHVLKKTSVDSETNVKFTTKIRKDENSHWLAEEVGLSGNPISQAIIADIPEISLFYTGERYIACNGVLNEKSRKDLPTAAKVMFLNQAAALGIIKWNSPLTMIDYRIIHPLRNLKATALKILRGR